MNILSIVLSVMAAIIVFVLVRAATISATYSINRETKVNRPSVEVFSYIKIIRNQEHFSKWAMQDPNQHITTSGIDGNVGFVYKWESDNKKVGQGEQTITAVTENAITSSVKFIKPFEGQIDGVMSAKPAGDGATQVIWVISGERNFTMRIFHVLFNIKSALGKDMEESLGNLKRVLEQ